ncbi:MAG: MBL fold metallo-hydrolase, partial [Alphaproteobacteria bacterium]
MTKIEATPAVNPALAEHAARFDRKIVQTGARTHTFIGYNIANVSIIEAPGGLILVDGMAQENDARDALADIRKRFPGQEIRAVVYTHFHNDHVNGIEGFIRPEDVEAGLVEVWAHADLMHFVTEVSAGTGPIMGRRASYTFGAALPRGEEG